MYNRREFLKSLGGAAALTIVPGVFKQAVAGNRIIVIGGGVAGARSAAYLKLLRPSSTVMLFDAALKRDPYNHSDNISGHGSVAKIDLSKLGVDLTTENIAAIDAQKKSVFLQNGKHLTADILVLAPGIDFRWDTIRGYAPGMEQDVLHAWSQQPGIESALWQQIKAMRNGDNVVISVPQAPYRFPQGPYQRATVIAEYLAASKPRSKVLLLDSNNEFPAMNAYLEQWQSRFPANKVEWVSAAKGGIPERFDIHNKTVYLADETIRAGVLNLIPAQYAGRIARQAGLSADGHWCSVDPQTMESRYFKNVYVLGDANNANPFEKTAVVAEQHALQSARHISSVLA